MEHRVRQSWRCAAIAALVFAAAAVGRAEPGAQAEPSAHSEPGAQAQALPDRTERVMGLARVWAKVKFFHPYLAYKDIDWDAALVAAIPRAEAATSIAAYRVAVQGMLAALGDPVTRVLDPTGAPTGAAGSAAAGDASWLMTPAPGVLEVRIAGMLANGTDYVQMNAQGRKAAAEAAKASALVIDLRVPRGLASAADLAVEALDAALPAVDEWPLERVLEHHGYRTQDGVTSGGYFSTFITTDAQPARPGPAHGPSHVVFLVDPDSGVPAVALALQAAGRATLVSRGAIREDGALTTTDLELPGALTAHIRLGELLWGPPTADIIVARDADVEPRGLAAARAAQAARPRARSHKLAALPPLRPRDDLDYADPVYPSREHRLLAGIRIWAVLEYFFPYRYLIPDWDAALREALPRLAEAGDVDAYRKALRLMSARAGDGHIGVQPAAGPARKPRGAPAIAARLIEHKLAVTQLLAPADAAQHGVAVGDVIETIDGVPTAAALADKRAEVSGSTDEARDQRAASNLLVGDDGTSVALGVRGAAGKLHDETLTRSAANLTALYGGPPGPHWKLLPGNIGYVDLRALIVAEVGTMFDELKATGAIVFDMRGYPNGTAWPIAPRINTHHARYVAQFLQPLVRGDSGDTEEGDRRTRFLQLTPAAAKDAAIYTGKIVVLIDDRAISQAEHTCLFFAETAGATFIGSPTHGANGDVTVARLPGGLRMSFTGQEVRHVDGRQLQKVGIQPDVQVRPTLAGVRAGKDEVLDRALAFLSTGH